MLPKWLIPSHSRPNSLRLRLTKLAPRIGLDGAALASKLEPLDDRIAEIEEETQEASSPSFSSTPKETDKFDDVALMNLFAPLISRR
jgi:hypothetical protein